MRPLSVLRSLMSKAITADPARGRIQVACDGPGSRAEWLRTIHELGGHERLRPAWRVVIDARGHGWPVGLDDVQAIRASFRAETRPGRPIAVRRRLAGAVRAEGLSTEQCSRSLLRRPN